MSSRTRTRSERRRRRAPALLLVLLAALIAGQSHGPGAAAAPVPLPITAVLTRGAQTSLVVDLSASTRSGPRSASVTRAGVPQPAKLVPVLSDGLAVALVVDASTAGAATLPAWQSAAARFILEAPASTEAVVIADSAPAAAITEPQRGPSGIVRGLTNVPARGERDTAAALALAMRQFPARAPGRRLVLLYTTAANAGGEIAADLAARFRASGTILVVVGTVGTDPYWANTAAATGGFFAPAGNPVVIPALDQVETILRGRYLVEFATPPTLPAPVSVRVSTRDLTLTGDTIVPPAAQEPAPPARNGDFPSGAALLGLAVAGLVAGLATVLLRRRRRRRAVVALPDPPGTEVPAGAQVSAVARGRAVVPAPMARGPVARGRATVHGTVNGHVPGSGTEVPPPPARQ